ncbi:unnamed protein product [Parascedosporium putredinis]|uniref:Uncharacterized protein n=1 Tax=Parascedosporium putredinis TaxID=1442378 RepID=A0A9P1GUG9_9PEZI|nr:unnamed protein product [Parascedosporium putredinis]CAI7987561.1 unnamed protein product [Parascedosporium putredinis]
MGIQALEANGITAKLIFLGRDKALTPPSHPLLKIRRRRAIWFFVAIELVGFGATFAITQTIAAVGFLSSSWPSSPSGPCCSPLVLGRGTRRPRRAHRLPFTMESCGGIHGAGDTDTYDTDASKTSPPAPTRRCWTALISRDGRRAGRGPSMSTACLRTLARRERARNRWKGWTVS